jgi:M6 family metalloprotease-like protein
MAILKQSATSKTLYAGWYGKCSETNCEEGFDLYSDSRIAYVYKTTEDGGVKTFLASISAATAFLNNFTKLECGNAYWIVLSTGDGEVDIPGFTISDVESDFPSNFKTLTTTCEGGVSDGVTPATPTPQSSDPTPTPQPSTTTPTKKRRIPVILFGWNDGNPEHSVHFQSNKLLWSRGSSEGGSDQTRRLAEMTDIYDMLNKSLYSWPYAKDGHGQKPTGSVADYYRSISFGQMEVEFVIVPAGTDPNPDSNNPNDYAYIIEDDFRLYGGTYIKQKVLKGGGDGIGAASKMLEAAKKNLKSRGILFDKEDGNDTPAWFTKDDPIMLIHAGLDAARGSNMNGFRKSPVEGFIHSHFAWFTDLEYTKARGRKYHVQPFLYRALRSATLDLDEPRNTGLKQMKGRCTIAPIGTLLHETGHAWDIGDLYDTNTTGGVGAGYQLLMATGNEGYRKQGEEHPAFMSSYVRHYIGITKKQFDMEVVDITSDMNDIEIYPATDENKVYRIHHPSTSDEWWVEYRTDESKGYGDLINFDKFFPENGLSIVHISTTGGSTGNANEFPNHRRGESGYYVSCEQQDGQYIKENLRSNKQTKTDMFQEGHAFSPYTVPSSVSRSGVPSGIKLHNIRKTNNGSMLVDVEFISEPSGKIIFLDYSWSHTGTSPATLRSSDLSDDDMSVTILTENIPDGTTINMQVNPGYNQDTFTSNQVNGDRCDITWSGQDLKSLLRQEGGGQSKYHANYFRFSVAGDSEIFPWIDYVNWI